MKNATKFNHAANIFTQKWFKNASSLFHEYTPEKYEIHVFMYRNRFYNVSRPNFQSRHHAQNTLNSGFHVKNDPKNASRKNVCGGALLGLNQ